LFYNGNICTSFVSTFTTGKLICNAILSFPAGIKIGEIGTKLGMNATNNGFLGFDKVRIPRENMLMKNSQVVEKIKYRDSDSV